ncbi:uncharacterized protein LOC121386825 isoform X2 [Gigantopelta aegis]|uniref:uncharacterized protein LOC121386825 isoform X2 n=1 Tax=Gigantopelta aegis TaxID=1735272 RepID=UPI001B88A293|nr:uncharacterized protein LOC121386825 isoform X2 [Gigantopelta aegis]
MRFTTTAHLAVLVVSACILITHTQRQPNPPVSAESGSKNNASPAGARRPPIDTDGAVYQKTVGGVTFRIVAMCQDFEILMDKNMMEFDTVQNGCRFVVIWPKHLKVTDSFSYRPPNTAP